MSRRPHPLVTAVALVALALMVAPLAVVVLFSFNAGRSPVRLDGLSLAPYARLLEDEVLLGAIENSLLVAAASTAASTALGTALAIGVARYPWSPAATRRVRALVDLPVVTPDIVFAASIVLALKPLALVSEAFLPGRLAMILGHVAFQTSFVALLVESRLVTLGAAPFEAARDLGASGLDLLRRVTLPMTLPAIAGGAALAFVLSLDDFVISFFTAGPGSDTLPIVIYASLRRGITPEVYAASSGLLALTTALALGVAGLTGARRRE